jgi:DNA processing protein
MSADRLRLAVAAHAAFRGPARILTALHTGGLQELKRAYDELDDAGRGRVDADVDELVRQSVGVALLGDRDYPVRLASLPSPPPILYYRGNASLLNAPSVGMCGSRDATDDGKEAAKVAGAAVAGAGLTIISGYARGVDTETHLAAIRAGGSTIIVLAEGITGFRFKRAFRSVRIDGARVLVISQFPPRQRWTVRGAMMRNAIIAGLGVALVVIEAGESGGTLDAGLKGIELKRPVFAIDFRSGERPGNAILFGRGAHRVGSTKALTDAIRAVNEAVEADRQLRLFDADASRSVSRSR